MLQALAGSLACNEALIAFLQFICLKVAPALTSCLMVCWECLLLTAESGQHYWKKAIALIRSSLKPCKFGLCKVILGSYPLKSLYTFLCENGRAEPFKWFPNESALNVVSRILNWLQWKHGMGSKVKESALWEFEWKLVTNKWKVLLFIHPGKQPVCSGSTSAQVCSLSIWIYTMLKWEPGQSRRCPCHEKQA